MTYVRLHYVRRSAEKVDYVTAHDHGEGVVEFITRLLENAEGTE